MWYRSLFVGLTLTLFSLAIHAQQPYDKAIGLRLGWSSGINFKAFIQDNLAFEGILGYHSSFISSYGGTHITALLEFHTPLEGVDGLYLYYGGGGHLVFGVHRGYDPYDPYYDRYRERYVGFGFDAIVGMGYKLPDDIPLAFSIDFKPHFTIPLADVRGYPYLFGDLAISGRYTF